MGIEYLASPVTIAENFPVLVAMLGAWVLLFTSFIVTVYWLVQNSVIHPWAAATAFIGIAGMLFPRILISWAAGSKFIRMYRDYTKKGLNPGLYVKRAALWFVLVIAVKIVALVICIYYIYFYYHMGVKLESQS